jgi:hypothetical protein
MTKFSIELLEKPIVTPEKWENNTDDYNPYEIDSLIAYNPCYKEYNNENFTYTQFNHKYHLYDNNTVVDEHNEKIEKQIFFKYAPLLDPCHYMIGKYKHDLHLKELPYYNNDNLHYKINSVHNASYVDNMCCVLINKLKEHYNFFNSVEYYGSYIGIQKQYRINVNDDIDYLQSYDFFENGLGKLFNTNIFDKDTYAQYTNNNSLKNKPSLNIEDDNVTIEVETLEIDETLNNEKTALDLVYENDVNDQESVSDNSIVSDSDEDNSSNEYSDNDENDDETIPDNEDSDEDSSIEEEPLYAYINDFPVQMICLEKCNNTFDNLLANNAIDEDQGRSALFQIIMILLTLQKAFNFTHNDLHTNNIMYDEVDYEYIYYVYNDKTYKVPTYGRIYKLIDFGRAIVTYNKITYCSDSFKEGGDAHTQYNFEPFYDTSKKKIMPNYSFDLCRLGCSIYDFIIDSEMKMSTMNDLQKTIARWCSDDNGKNILYKKNGEERYPNFKLYKMIARQVHNHTPASQLDQKFFKVYETTEISDNHNHIFNINEVHCYV